MSRAFQSSIPRRSFLKLSGAAVAGMLSSCRDRHPPPEFPIVMCDDLLAGHRLFENPPNWDGVAAEKRDLLIVGGGIAGLTAAFRLREREPLLCELSNSLGGSASYGESGGQAFAQGAHYELEYPASYGAEVLALLEELGLVVFDGVRNTWTFADRQYLIDPERMGRCWVRGQIREDMLPESAETTRFERMLEAFEGRMPLPLRLLDGALAGLNDLSFADYLREQGLALTPAFHEALDYHMKDDYGAGADAVSALAGIHYYRCRPYYHQHVGIFSPPRGNGYFVDKLARALPSGAIRVGHLVSAIRSQENGFLVDVWDVAGQKPLRFRARQVVYAGQKQGLRYSFPADAGLFASNRYAPWAVMSFLLEGPVLEEAWWQNEVLSRDVRFLGFVNSMVQSNAETGPNRAVLTAYYCLPEAQRSLLLEGEGFWRAWVVATLELIERVTGKKLGSVVREVWVKLHGHGMPIPAPGYLLRDANGDRSHDDLVYAGVDNGRLPLLYEAFDSGIQAAELLRF